MSSKTYVRRRPARECKRCGRIVSLSPSGHVHAHHCPHGALCVVTYSSRRMGKKPEHCEACLLGRNLTLPFPEVG